MKKFLGLLFMVIFLAACGETEEIETADTAFQNEESTDKIEIFTTVFPLHYFAERIGGEHVDVQSVYPPGSNVHTFEPTQQEMIALAEADILFYIGLEMEGFVENAKGSLQNERVEFVATTDAIPEAELAEGHAHDHEDGHAHEEEAEDHEHNHEEGIDEHDHGAVDPHVWLSPILSQKLAETIKNELTDRNPENAEEFEANYEELIVELQGLDESFKDLAENTGQKTFFVSHEAFGYIANTYGFEQIAVAGLNSEDEPSQKELTQIVELAKEQNIQYIAFEQNVSSKLAEVIQQEIEAEAIQLHNLSVLTQEDIDNGETYFTLMEKNLEIFAEILK